MNEEKNLSAGFTASETPLSTPQPSQGGAQEIAKQAAQTAQAEIQKLKGAAREHGSAAVEEIKTAAQSAAREAQEAGRDFVHEQKENLAQSMRKYAEALRAASERCAMRSKATCSQILPRRRRSNSKGCRATYARKSRLTFSTI